MQHLDYLYVKLVNGLVSTLLQELLVLGLFFVLYGYISQIIKKPELIKSSGFIKRIILLGNVSLFVFYIALTYFLPYTYVSVEEVIANIQLYSGDELARAKITLLIMSPIDLLSIVLLAGMYAALGIDNFDASIDSEIKTDKLGKRLKYLFLITSTWHFVTVIWWIVFSILTKEPLKVDDTLYHLTFSVTHFIGYKVWDKLRSRGINEWYAIAYYSANILIVYATRIWMYVDRLL